MINFYTTTKGVTTMGQLTVTEHLNRVGQELEHLQVQDHQCECGGPSALECKTRVEQALLGELVIG